jgi:hypothetical protein
VVLESWMGKREPRGKMAILNQEKAAVSRTGYTKGRSGAIRHRCLRVELWWASGIQGSDFEPGGILLPTFPPSPSRNAKNSEEAQWGWFWICLKRMKAESNCCYLKGPPFPEGGSSLNNSKQSVEEWVWSSEKMVLYCLFVKWGNNNNANPTDLSLRITYGIVLNHLAWRIEYKSCYLLIIIALFLFLFLLLTKWNIMDIYILLHQYS